ncbi:MAG: hypothetical protein ACE5HN_02440 [Nitrospiria bacterium]
MVQSTETALLPNRPKAQKKKKEGRGFFLTLLIVSGIIILFMTVLFFKGKEITIFTFQRFVVNKAFVSLMPAEYTLEETEAVRERVYDFYEAARAGEVSDQALLQVSTRIQSILEDQQILDEEIQSLLTLIEKGGGG